MQAPSRPDLGSHDLFTPKSLQPTHVIQIKKCPYVTIIIVANFVKNVKNPLSTLFSQTKPCWNTISCNNTHFHIHFINSRSALHIKS